MTKNLTLNEIFILTKFIKAVSRLDDETEKLIKEEINVVINNVLSGKKQGWNF